MAFSNMHRQHKHFEYCWQPYSTSTPIIPVVYPFLLATSARVVSLRGRPPMESGAKFLTTPFLSPSLPVRREALDGEHVAAPE